MEKLYKNKKVLERNKKRGNGYTQSALPTKKEER